MRPEGTATMKLVIAALLAAVLSLTGCRGDGDGETIANPLPGIESHAHGYETADGTTVRYGDVETDDKSSDGGGGGGCYDDRAVAR